MTPAEDNISEGMPYVVTTGDGGSASIDGGTVR